jgi:hypothetical protein
MIGAFLEVSSRDPNKADCLFSILAKASSNKPTQLAHRSPTYHLAYMEEGKVSRESVLSLLQELA